MSFAHVIAVAAVVAAPAAALGGDAPAPNERTLSSRLWDAIRARLAEATAPAPVPPTPVDVRWRSRRIASVELGAPLLSLAAGDLDRDGTAELVALTSREVVVARRTSAKRVTIVARAPLPPSPAAPRSRDTVGALVIATDDAGAPIVIARTSEQGTGGKWRLRNGALEQVGVIQGFPVCDRAVAGLFPGRNYFLGDSFAWTGEGDAPAVPERFFSVACRGDLVDPSGRPQRAFGVVDVDGVVRVTLAAGAPVEVRNRGAALALSDVDNDGSVELVTTTNRAPGRGGQVQVYSLRADGAVRVARSKKFTGGVAAVATGDIDGDGDRDVIAAVRLIGATRVDLWSLN